MVYTGTLLKKIKNFFTEFNYSINSLNLDKIDKIAKLLNQIRKNKGRVFFHGVVGSAGNATHAVNDFRKL